MILVMFLLVVAAGGVPALWLMPPGSLKPLVFMVTFFCVVTSAGLVAMEWRRSSLSKKP